MHHLNVRARSQDEAIDQAVIDLETLAVEYEDIQSMT
jgi:hypothetical protein